MSRNIQVQCSIVKFNGSSSARNPIQKIALLGNYLPRQCGIATFTSDLAETLSELDPSATIDVIAMSDRSGYTYPERVSHEIAQEDPYAYLAAANLINRRGYDVLSVQHEYGIFGGEAGSHLMSLVREAKMPIVTTLHTVLREPSAAQKAVLDELLQLSERVVVMSQKAVEFLVEVHDVSLEKIDLIPHGIPLIEEADGKDLRAKLGIEGPMILTFGLLSSDKGIQYVIEAMPKIVAEYPGATYVVLGATHPNVRASAGESYREGLVKLAEALGVSRNVRFVDRFVETEELVQYLAATDYYVTPYLNPKQITSGTLAYSVGAGKAVISTPYWYAEEMLAEGRGALVKFRDADSIAQAVLALQGSPKTREEMGRRAADFGKQMLWPAVGRRYLACFARAKRDSASNLRILVKTPSSSSPSVALDLPKLNLDHLCELSDDTGIVQHATFTVPNRSEGYCVDDNARALLFTAYLESLSPLSSEVSLLQSRYLGFVLNAFNPEKGRFRNFMSYAREWLDDAGSDDSQGRSLWSLGVTVNRCKDIGRRDVARALFLQSAPALYATTSLRTWAYAVLATDEYLKAFPHDYAVQVLQQTMSKRIWECWQLNQSTDWPWFEQSLTYGNARISQALIIGGEELGNHEMLSAGLESLEWLMNLQTGPKDVFAPIGSNGFYTRNGTRSYFDQQPIEAWSAVSACLLANQITGDPKWLGEAQRSFRWFLGANMVGQPVYDEKSGGCHDGLHPDSLNRNQGAESTLAYLCSLAELKEARMGSRVVPSEIDGHRLL